MDTEPKQFSQVGSTQIFVIYKCLLDDVPMASKSTVGLKSLWTAQSLYKMGQTKLRLHCYYAFIVNVGMLLVHSRNEAFENHKTDSLSPGQICAFSKILLVENLSSSFRPPFFKPGYQMGTRPE